MCMHRRDWDAQTTASMIAALAPGSVPRAWVSLGNPCTSVFVPCFPPAIPPELADAAQWRRFAHVRDLVEADPDRLAHVRQVLGATEAELWSEADAAFASGDAARLAAFAGTSFPAVDAALRRLGIEAPTTVAPTTDGVTKDR